MFNKVTSEKHDEVPPSERAVENNSKTIRTRAAKKSQEQQKPKLSQFNQISTTISK